MGERTRLTGVKPYGTLQLIAVFCALAVGIGVAGFLYYKSQKRAIERSKHNELSAIAQLKVDQISGWRKERIEDGAVYGNNPMFAEGVHRWLDNRGDSGLERKILAWLKTIEKHHDYASVSLADREGALRLSTDDGYQMDGYLTDYLPQVVDRKRPLISGFFRTEAQKSIRLCLFVPVLNPLEQDGPIVGILLMLIDPYEYLYPLIQSLPTPSQTSETLLIYRSGDTVLYLNELRHKAGAALSLQFPVTEEQLPSAKLARGEQGIVKGIDYRGIPVLASIQPIADSPWFLVTKVDADEVLKPVRERAILVALAVALLIGAAGGGLALISSRQGQEALLQTRIELERRVEDRTRELVRANEILQREVMERIRAEEALKLDEARLEALLELSEITTVSTTKRIGDLVLEHGIRLTGSRIGFLGFFDEEEEAFTFLTSSKGDGKQCALCHEAAHMPVANAGVWAEAIQRREPIIVNDYGHTSGFHHEGHPAGTVPLKRFMSVPVLSKDRIVAIVAVANKEVDYDTSDVRQLNLLMDGMWKVLERDRAEEALRESESLAAMGRALSSVAHDIKTPLIAIGGFTRLVQGHMPRENPDWEKLEIVLKETRRLESMIKDMLDFSRPLELNRSLEDIGQVIEESLAIVTVLAQERGVSVENRSAKILTKVSMDAMRMKQVIINLVMNGVQASSPGQTVTVCTRRSRVALLIDISDNGCGIPPEQRDSIFTPFFTTKKEGTGLGLAIVKKIVEAHKGRVEILDNSRAGVTFRIVVPIA
jgi:signal transduction histidine kinase